MIMFTLIDFEIAENLRENEVQSAIYFISGGSSRMITIIGSPADPNRPAPFATSRNQKTLVMIRNALTGDGSASHTATSED